MTISRSRAIFLGDTSILGIIYIEAFNSFICYDNNLQKFLTMLGIFVISALFRALVSLLTSNPLRAVGACMLFAPWLILGCGGESMIYVAVILWGTISSIIGAFITGPIMRLVGVSVDER